VWIYIFTGAINAIMMEKGAVDWDRLAQDRRERLLRGELGVEAQVSSATPADEIEHAVQSEEPAVQAPKFSNYLLMNPEDVSPRTSDVKADWDLKRRYVQMKQPLIEGTEAAYRELRRK
jgi:hypothetical protein